MLLEALYGVVLSIGCLIAVITIFELTGLGLIQKKRK